jgi:hypothetical protein
MNPTNLAIANSTVSPSMVRSVFSELKANGYSDGQIAALSLGLMRMASEIKQPEREFPQDAASENQLLGLPEEFESVYLANLM